MKRSVIVLALAAAAALAPFHPSHARSSVRWRGPGGWGTGDAFSRLYDPRSLETLRGVVLRVERVTPLPGMSLGVVLVLASGSQTFPVYLGPLWYLDHQEMRIAPADKVEVRGARTVVRGKPAILAAEVVKGDRVLRLRDEAGAPAWSAWRRSGAPPGETSAPAPGK